MGSPALPAKWSLVSSVPLKYPRTAKGGLPRPKTYRGTRPILSWRDYILPELVSRAENGDPSVRVSPPRSKKNRRCIC
jgi:hypothetical protein